MSAVEDTDMSSPHRMSPRKNIFKRRESVADEAAMTQAYIQGNIGILTQLWDEVHMSEENRVSRLHKAYDHIRTLVDDMVEAETNMVRSVKDGITAGEAKIRNLRKELKLEPWECHHPYPSIARLREIERDETVLEEIYNKRLAEQEKIVKRIEILCDRLGTNLFENLPETKKLLTQDEMKQLQENLVELEAMHYDRLSKAIECQKELRMWYKHLGRAYGENDEAALKVFLEEDVEDNNFLLTSSVMETIERFRQELSGMHESWVQDMDIEWATHYEELQELWDKCHISEQERIYSARFDPARHSQEDIDTMTDEIIRLKEVYKERQPIYKILADFKEAWKQKLDFEEKKKDVNYYRAHNFMRDIQLERHVNDVKLPSLKKSLAAGYRDYKKNHAEDRVLIEGYEPIQYIEWMEAEYNLTKERERSAKVAQRKTPHDPRASLKSKIGLRTPATSSKIPSKQPRLTTDQCSIITPTRTQEHGPKTSSPKGSGSALSTPKRLLSPFKRRNNP